MKKLKPVCSDVSYRTSPKHLAAGHSDSRRLRTALFFAVSKAVPEQSISPGLRIDSAAFQARDLGAQNECKPTGASLGSDKPSGSTNQHSKRLRDGREQQSVFIRRASNRVPRRGQPLSHHVPNGAPNRARRDARSSWRVLSHGVESHAEPRVSNRACRTACAEPRVPRRVTCQTASKRAGGSPCCPCTGTALSSSASCAPPQP